MTSRSSGSVRAAIEHLIQVRGVTPKGGGNAYHEAFSGYFYASHPLTCSASASPPSRRRGKYPEGGEGGRRLRQLTRAQHVALHLNEFCTSQDHLLVRGSNWLLHMQCRRLTADLTPE